jgi:twinkle protein
MAAVLKLVSPTGAERSVDIDAFMRSQWYARIVSAGNDEVRDKAWHYIQQRDGTFGDAMPWAKTHQKMRFRPGEVTAWIGPNRDGKSLLLGYLAAKWALQETPVLMCSLEMDVGLQIKRLSRQLLCTETPVLDRLDMLLRRLSLYMQFFNHVGHVPPRTMTGLSRWAGSQGQFRHVIIDNLTLIVPPGRNTDEDSAIFVRSLVEVARDTGTHIHLVGHIRKPERDDRMLNRYDWRGTGACADMVSNVLIVQSNEKKRRKAANGDFSMADKPDVFVTVDKQRNGEFHGQFGFWWRPAALQLVEYGSDEPTVFDPFDLSLWDH